MEIIKKHLSNAQKLLDLAKTNEGDFTGFVTEALKIVQNLEKASFTQLAAPASGDWMKKNIAQDYINNYKGLPESFIVDANKLSSLCNLEDVRYIQILVGDKNATKVSTELTLLLVGLDINCDHKYYDVDKVLEYVQPCPNDTPTVMCASNQLG
jgi:hypothetical protein